MLGFAGGLKRGKAPRPLHPFGCTPLKEVSNGGKILGFFYSKGQFKLGSEGFQGGEGRPPV